MPLFRHEIVHDGKNSLFHLSCVLGAKYHHFSLLEVEADCHIPIDVWYVFIGHKLTSVENVIIRAIREIFVELFSSGPD